jgi:hypothetical protein
MIINVIHLLFVAPLLILVGHIAKGLVIKVSDKDKLLIFNIQIAIGVIVALYHGYLIYSNMNN